MTDPHESLSPAGLLRREAILRATLGTVRERRRRRRTVQLMAAVAAVALLALLSYPRRPTGAAAPQPGPLVVLPPSTGPSNPPGNSDTAGPLVQVIPADPTVSTRLAVPALPPTWRSIDDDVLLATLAETGQPAGLVRINGQTLLLARR